MTYSIITDDNIIVFMIRKLELLLEKAKKQNEISKSVLDVYTYFYDLYSLQIDCEIENPLIFFNEMDLDRFNFWACSWTNYDLIEIERLSIKYL